MPLEVLDGLPVLVDPIGLLLSLLHLRLTSLLQSPAKLRFVLLHRLISFLGLHFRVSVAFRPLLVSLVLKDEDCVVVSSTGE